VRRRNTACDWEKIDFVATLQIKSWAKPISKISAIIPWAKPTNSFHLISISRSKKSISDFNVSFSKTWTFFNWQKAVEQKMPAEGKFFSKQKNQQILFKKAALVHFSDHYQIRSQSLSDDFNDCDQHASSLFSNFWL